MSWRLLINRMAPIIDTLSSTKYDDQRITRDLPVKVAHKIEMPMILDMMLRLYTPIHPMY